MSSVGGELDPVAILAAVGMVPPERVERVRGGVDAAIWRVEVAGATHALRLLWPVQAGQARREAAAMRAAAAGGVPVPVIVAEGAWRGHPATVMTWAAGRTLAEELLADPLDLPHARALGADLGRVQAAIHALPVTDELATHPESWWDWAGHEEAPARSAPAAAGSAEGGSAGDSGLRRRPEAVEARSAEGGTLRGRLAAAVARDPRPDAVIHLDLHPLNVLVDGATARVTAVLDWANSRVGDPRADLARTLSILRLAPLPPEADRATVTAALRALEASWLGAYEAEAGPVGDLAPFCWWAGAVMERDLGRWVGRADLPWLTEAYLDGVRAWTAGWRG